MTNMNRREFLATSAVTLTALAGFGLTGCNLSGSATSETKASGGTKIKIVTSNAATPYCYLDDSGQVIGYDIDVLKLCEKKLNGKYDFEFEGMEFRSMISSLESSACDLVSCALARTNERLQKFVFPTEPYCVGPMCAVVRKDSGITDAKTLAGKKLYVDPTNAYYQALSKYNEEHPSLAINLSLQADAGDYATWLRAVANGQTDAAYILTSKFESAQKAAGTDLTTTATVTNGLDFFMLRKDRQELADDISKALKEAKQDGTLLELEKKWLGSDVFGDNQKFVDDGADMIVDDGATVYSVARDGVVATV